MKKIFMLCVALFALCACEKQLQQESVGSGDEDGNLVVRVFQIENTSFESFTRTSITDVISRMNFAVYASDGTRAKQVNQTADQDHYGTCSFQLAEGTYRLVVVAHSSNGNPTMADASCIKFTNSQGFTNTYMNCQEVVIANENVEVPVSLNRIVALCRFVVTDDFPAEVKKLRFYYTGGSGAFDALTGLGCVNSKQDVKFAVDGSQKQFDLYTFLHDTEGTIHLTVTALDANDSELYTQVIDVPLYQNHITWVSGAIFSGGTSSSTATITGVTINTDWAGEHFINF